jgi:hypothetical protein
MRLHGVGGGSELTVGRDAHVDAARLRIQECLADRIDRHVEDVPVDAAAGGRLVDQADELVDRVIVVSAPGDTAARLVGAHEVKPCRNPRERCAGGTAGDECDGFIARRRRWLFLFIDRVHLVLVFVGRRIVAASGSWRGARCDDRE